MTISKLKSLCRLASNKRLPLKLSLFYLLTFSNKAGTAPHPWSFLQRNTLGLPPAPDISYLERKPERKQNGSLQLQSAVAKGVYWSGRSIAPQNILSLIQNFGDKQSVLWEMWKWRITRIPLLIRILYKIGKTLSQPFLGMSRNAPTPHPPTPPHPPPPPPWYRY